ETRRRASPCTVFFQAEDGIRDFHVTGVQTCALPIFDCHTLEQFADVPERWLDVSWDEDDQQALSVGRISIIIANEPGALSGVTSDRKSVVQGNRGGAGGRCAAVERQGGIGTRGSRRE